MSSLSSLVVNPRDSRELFIAGNWQNLFSSDAGRTWTERVRGADVSCIQDVQSLGGKTYVVAR